MEGNATQGSDLLILKLERFFGEPQSRKYVNRLKSYSILLKLQQLRKTEKFITSFNHSNMESASVNLFICYQCIVNGFDSKTDALLYSDDIDDLVDLLSSSCMENETARLTSPDSKLMSQTINNETQQPRIPHIPSLLFEKGTYLKLTHENVDSLFSPELDALKLKPIRQSLISKVINEGFSENAMKPSQSHITPVRVTTRKVGKRRGKGYNQSLLIGQTTPTNDRPIRSLGLRSGRRFQRI